MKWLLMEDKGLNEGYIKLWRKILSNPTFMMDSVTFHLTGYLLLKANHKRKTFPFNRQLVTVDRGQLITGRDQITADTGITPRQTRTRLALLKKTGFLTIKTTNRYSIISICNYDYYQDSNPSERPARRPANDQQTTTNNNDKNEKNIKIECNDFESLEGFLSSLPEFNSFSFAVRDLIQEFINKVREANRAKTIRGRRIAELLGWFGDILDSSDEESLLVGLRRTFKKAEKDGFDFKKRNPTGYVWSVAKSHKVQKDQTRLLTHYLEEKEELRKVPEGKTFQDLKTLIGGAA